MESTKENDSSARETPPEETPGPDASGKGFSFWRPAQPSFPEPKPAPRWMVVAGECALFGLPVLLIAAPFSPRLPDRGPADHWAATLDLAVALAVVFGAGAAIRAFVLSPVSRRCGAALRRFGERARGWYAAGPNRSAWTCLALAGLWAFAFQLPRLSDLRAPVFAGTFVFCLAASFVLFTAGLMVMARKERAADRRRALVMAIVAPAVMATVIVSVPVILARRRTAFRRRWKNDAVERIAMLSEDASWAQEQIRAAENRERGLYGRPDLAWLREDIIVMADGDWIVYRASGPHHDRRMAADIFIGRASSGKWYYSTYHFCTFMYGLRSCGQPPDIPRFIEAFGLEEFDGKSDKALDKTCGGSSTLDLTDWERCPGLRR